MTDKIIRLAPKAEKAKSEANEGMVQTLREIIEAVERGEVGAIGVAMVQTDGGVSVSVDGTDWVRLLGATTLLQHDILHMGSGMADPD